MYKQDIKRNTEGVLSYSAAWGYAETIGNVDIALWGSRQARVLGWLRLKLAPGLAPDLPPSPAPAPMPATPHSHPIDIKYKYLIDMKLPNLMKNNITILNQ